MSGGTGATAATYSTALLGLADTGRQYRVLASNSAGSTGSPPVTVTVTETNVPPSIVAQPTSLSVVTGSEALFAAVARGTEALSYQWRRDGVPIPGASGVMLELAAVSAADVGDYSLEVSNTAGRITTATARLTVNAAVATVIAPSIVTHPAAVAVTEGNVATFAVGVTGSGPITFQWRKNGTDIAGATAAAVTLPAVAMADAGNYSVRVANGAGSVTSQAATLAVVAATGTTPTAQAPGIVTQPGSLVAAPGMAAMFGVGVQGSGPMSFVWLRDGAPVPGQTAAVFALASVSGADAGSYQVLISNSAGTVTSAPSQLTLLGAPAITGQPAAATAAAGATATFSVGASGDNLRHLWLRNGIAIADATASNYTTPALTLADGGAVYSVAVCCARRYPG